ncbi:MAG: acyltransferase [Clostridia bacterium]
MSGATVMKPVTDRPRHVYAVDFARAATILAVVAVHAVRFGAGSAAPVAEGLVQLWLQFGREVFMAVTGFVLVYAYGYKRPRWLNFYQKRFQNTGVPYLIWLGFFLALSTPLWPVLPFLRTWLAEVPNGAGHLYYLVITFQFYAIVPLWIWLERRIPDRWLLLGAFIIQIGGFTLASLGIPGAAPQLWATTYLFDFALGAAAAMHWSTVADVIRRHRRHALVGLALGMALVAGVYAADMAWHVAPPAAASVFQPLSTVYTALVMAAVLAAGTWFEEVRERFSRFSVVTMWVADASFGIYLVHTLFLHLVLEQAPRLSWLGPWGLSTLAFVAASVASVATVRLLRLTPVANYVVGQNRLNGEGNRRAPSQVPAGRGIQVAPSPAPK